MHWGLTTFERKRIERIALDHPFFDMHAPLLTKKELHPILAQGPHKTGPQVIAEVKKELNMKYVPVIEKKRTLIEALRDASFVPSFRRTVVLGVLCLMMVLFMTLTVPGRAIAEEVYSIIVNYINGYLQANSSSPVSSAPDWDFLSLAADLNSPSALAKELDCSIVVTDDELTSFRYVPIDSHSLLIRSKYHNNEGKSYVIEQKLYSEDILWGYGADMYTDAPQVQAGIDIKMYGGSSVDGAISLVGFTSNSTIQILSKQLTASELIPIAKKLYYVSK